MTRPLARRALPTVAAAALVLGVAACSSADQGSDAGDRGIVASFYPLQLVTQQVAGSSTTVASLTKPGAEPHDLELAPQDIARLTRARLVVYARGFQPAVDEAVAEADPGVVLDVSGSARLSLGASDEHAHEGESPEEHADHAEPAHGGQDPHFWLDPQRYAAVAKAVGERLATDDPARAATYRANAAAFVARLDALDAEFETGLAQCRSRVLVSSHAAFGYLAERYDLEQHGITGVSPEAEPSAAGLKEVSDLVRSEGVRTIFQETLVEPHFAQTVASATGATVATLDPVEGITGESAGTDYFEVMRSNLTALRTGLGCS